MTPRLASRVGERGDALDTVAREQGAWCWFAIGLFAVTATIGVALIVGGAKLPTLGPALLLAVALVVAVNRFALFPTELAITAEVAVLLAAVVGLADQSPFVGPWLVAALAGPLDVVHWRQRSFVRMVYNSGNRMAATLAASAAFVCAFDRPSSTIGAVAVAALGASIAFALVEGSVGTVLARLRTEPTWREAVRVEAPMELLTVPLALVGATAGHLATDVGWWSTALVLAPTVFVPELVLAHGRRARALVSHAWPAVTTVVALVALAFVGPLPRGWILGGLVVVALLVGVDGRVDARTSVPRAATAVVAAALVVGGNARVTAAIVVAVTATAAAWTIARTTRWWAPLHAAGAALAVALAVDARPSTSTALAAALVFALLVATPPQVVVWMTPFVCVALSLATEWRALGAWGPLVFALVLFATTAAASTYGAPPWGSRRFAPWVSRHVIAMPRAILVTTTAVATTCAGVALAFTSTRAVLVPCAAAAAAAVATIVSVTVWQWRFAPRARARDVTVSVTAAAVVVLVYPSGASTGQSWSAVVLAVALVACVAVASPLLERVRLAGRRSNPASTAAGADAEGDARPLRDRR